MCVVAHLYYHCSYCMTVSSHVVNNLQLRPMFYWDVFLSIPVISLLVLSLLRNIEHFPPEVAGSKEAHEQEMLTNFGHWEMVIVSRGSSRLQQSRTRVYTVEIIFHVDRLIDRPNSPYPLRATHKQQPEGQTGVPAL